MTLHQKILEQEKEFEDSFGLDHPIRTFRDHDDYLLVKSHIRTSLISLFEDNVRRIKEKIRHHKYTAGKFADNMYVYTLYEEIDYYQKLIEELK